MALIDELSGVLASSEDMQGFWGRLDAGEDAAMGIAASARPLMAAARFARVPQATLVVVAGEGPAAEFARSLAGYVGDERVLRFAERADKPWDDTLPDAAVAAERMQALDSLASGDERMVVASARALLRCLPPVGTPFYKPLELSVGEDLSAAEGIDGGFEGLPLAIEALGYRNTVELEGPGTYAVRGGVVDIHPGNLAFPVRIDCFGDEVDEIRRIVPSTGQTISPLASVRIYPVREFSPSKRAMARAREALSNPARTNPVLRELLAKMDGGVLEPGSDALLPYLFEHTATVGQFLGSSCLTVLVEPRSLIDDALHAHEQLESACAGTGISLDGLYAEPSKLDFGTNQRCTFQSIMRIGGAVDIEVPVKRTEVAGDPEKLYGRLRSFMNAGMVTVFSAPNHRVRQDVKLELVDRGLPINEMLDVSDGREETRGLQHRVINVVDTPIPLGMVIPKAGLALVSMADTQGQRASRSISTVDVTQITFPFAPGDYVVHAMHGVALFKELVRQQVGGVERDYLLLEYAADDKLYVPVEQLDRVTRYVGPEGANPRLTRLNTGDWSRAIARARKASRKLAFDLVDVYTRRAAARGYQYGADTPWQREMEDAFPYQETPDQLAAIADVKADMQSSRPMDRLVCGDVGFGKTEVALRAAFKAVQAGKQVMVLCPTTILAQQHFTTFTDRFSPFGVHVEVLSRFRTPAQQSSALEGFADGSVEVLIGTHRLLSRDVNPHDLGLVIIDEEQRFGVGHKEQMKNLRESIDVLTLSATPIPRTMQMSLSGVRDMSLILTPPDDRRPVEVHVGEWDPDVVSGAIRRELERGGQVYYVSNRVRSIDEAVARVQEAAGEARVGVAHGQMSREVLEAAMEDFSAGQIDVLVATTIIESGIDNPHTNTLIIEDAQRLGLAQMYQLKGRVGRSSRQAYAYFMFPENTSLTEEATARLLAIDEHQGLGSGMRVAMRDLEIRGAGSLLGAEQSGNMSAVGFDLFAQMIATAVNDAREGRGAHDAEDAQKGAEALPSALSDITVNLPEHAYISQDYIADTDERVMLYRKVSFAGEVAQVDALEAQTLSAHPDMPPEARNYFQKARIKAQANEMGVEAVTLAAGRVQLEPVAKPAGELWNALRRSRARYVPATGKLQVPVSYFGAPEDGSLLEGIFAFMKDLA